MTLQDVAIHEDYRSDRNDLICDFYVPCLSQSVRYDRAVGFFSSTSMAAVACGLATFIRAEGKMRLIASPYLLSAKDVEYSKCTYDVLGIA
ncbi:dna phosphorothioation system restriction enzyme [Leptolyngbya sp. Heron Island J]|uniref:dna phosphorothioation system restriction enzyme n=1 Tax=Leptolyngbya sp. Heron Island J TaxID=1385935 RepID=UPI0003B96FBF|nr:dna phosphorothioation system restriction enzyme [Leptolyngbya sp. Heron Island J]ESA37379.1 dna phosphorothioation system restriction enzyme [Leptolyngbya sp. Heron Island J]